MDVTGISVVMAACGGFAHAAMGWRHRESPDLYKILATTACAGGLPGIFCLFIAAATGDLSSLKDGWRLPLAIACVAFVIDALRTLGKVFIRPSPGSSQERAAESAEHD